MGKHDVPIEVFDSSVSDEGGTGLDSSPCPIFLFPMVIFDEEVIVATPISVKKLGRCAYSVADKAR